MAPLPYEKLSEILPQFAEEKQYTVYLRIKAAIRDGDWPAVPLQEWVTIPRKNKPLKVPDLLIAAWVDSWIKHTMIDLATPKPKKRNPLGVSEADLESGKVSFDELAKQYRESLQPKAKKRKKRSAKMTVKEPQPPAEG